MDLAVANYFDVSVLLGTGAGSFGTATNYTTVGTGSHSVTSEDVNGDGKNDLVVSNSDSNNIPILFCMIKASSTHLFIQCVVK